MNNDNTNDSITLINKYNVVSQHSNNKHTTQVSKIFIFMVVRNLLRATGGQLDPLQFTYRLFTLSFSTLNPLALMLRSL